MLKFLARRLALAFVTLWLLSVIVFALGPDAAGQRRAQRARRLRLAGVGRRLQPRARPRPPGLEAVPRLGRATPCAAISASRTPRTNRSTRSSRAPSPSRSSSRCCAFVIMLPLAFLGGIVSALRAYKGTDRVDQHRRALVHRGAGVRLGAARDRRLRHRPRLAARDGALARRVPARSRRCTTCCCRRSCSSACSSATSRAWCAPARSRRSTPTTRARPTSRA